MVVHMLIKIIKDLKKMKTQNYLLLVIYTEKYQRLIIRFIQMQLENIDLIKEINEALVKG